MSYGAVGAAGYIAARNGKNASENPHSPNGFKIVKWLYNNEWAAKDGKPHVRWEGDNAPDVDAVLWASGWKAASGPWCYTCHTHREDVYLTGRCYECYNALYAWKLQPEEVFE